MADHARALLAEKSLSYYAPKKVPTHSTPSGGGEVRELELVGAKRDPFLLLQGGNHCLCKCPRRPRRFRKGMAVQQAVKRPLRQRRGLVARGGRILRRWLRLLGAAPVQKMQLRLARTA